MSFDTNQSTWALAAFATSLPGEFSAVLGQIAALGFTHVDVVAEIENGFGDSATGEDRFDAFVGLLSMIDVISGPGVPSVPADAYIRRWEGWILARGRPAC